MVHRSDSAWSTDTCLYHWTPTPSRRIEDLAFSLCWSCQMSFCPPREVAFPRCGQTGQELLLASRAVLGSQYISCSKHGTAFPADNDLDLKIKQHGFQDSPLNQIKIN